MRQTRGFNLVEAVLAFALFLLVLSLVAQGFRQLTTVTRYFDSKSQSFAIASDVLNRMARDGLEATRILVPAPGDTALYDQLQLQRTSTASWDNYFPTPAPTPFQPQAPATQENVRYFILAGQLRCEIGSDNQLLAPQVQSLTVQRTGEITLELRISLLEGSRLLTFGKCLWLPQSLRRLTP